MYRLSACRLCTQIDQKLRGHIDVRPDAHLLTEKFVLSSYMGGKARVFIGRLKQYKVDSHEVLPFGPKSTSTAQIIFDACSDGILGQCGTSSCDYLAGKRFSSGAQVPTFLRHPSINRLND